MIHTRPAAETDYDAFVALNLEAQQLHTDAVPLVFKPASAFDRAEFARALADPKVGVIVAEGADARVVGYAYCEIFEMPETPIAYARKYVYIAHLSVLSTERGRGVGRALLDACRDFARARGIPRIELDSYAFNGRALAAFRQYGFELIRYRFALRV